MIKKGGDPHALGVTFFAGYGKFIISMVGTAPLYRCIIVTLMAGITSEFQIIGFGMAGFAFHFNVGTFQRKLSNAVVYFLCFPIETGVADLTTGGDVTLNMIGIG